MKPQARGRSGCVGQGHDQNPHRILKKLGVDSDRASRGRDSVTHIAQFCTSRFAGLMSALGDGDTDVGIFRIPRGLEGPAAMTEFRMGKPIICAASAS